MELTTKTLCGGRLATALLLASALLSAPMSQASDDEDWLNKSGFGFFEGFYTSLRDYHGGGYAMGGEYANRTIPWGIGGKLNLSMLFGSEDTSQFYTKGDSDVSDVFGGADIYLLARAMDVVTLYGGCGVNFHNLEYTFDNNETIGPDGTGHRTTENVFFGARWVFWKHGYLFAEYRREFGEVQVVEDVSTRRGTTRFRYNVDMSDNRVVIGLGALF